MKKKVVEDKVQKAGSLTLQVDAWTNLKKEAIMNFVLTTPQPVYYDSTNIGTNHENAQFIHDKIKKIIDELEVRKLVAVVTDNVSCNK